MPLVGSIPSSLSDTAATQLNIVVLIFSSNALLFVHDLSRPHSHACYPQLGMQPSNSCSVRYTHHHTIILANSFVPFSSPALPRLIYPIVTHNDARCLPPPPFLTHSTYVVYPLVYTLMTRSWMDSYFPPSSSSSPSLPISSTCLLTSSPPTATTHRACRYLFRCSLVFYLSACQIIHSGSLCIVQ